MINGIDGGDRSGNSVSSGGDINGDGVDDLIIGASNADPNGNTSGESYVVFGSNSGFAASLDLSTLDGSNGFILNGIDGGDTSGRSVSGGGDINGDGVDDLIIGASNADPNGNSNAGETYVVFGFSSNTAPIANDDAVNTDEDTAIPVITVLANDNDPDGDPLTVTGFDATGTVGTVTNNGDGTFSYDPNGQFESLNTGDVATDSFTYTISDGTDSDTATVTVTINGVDEPLNLVGTNQKDTLIGGGGNDTISGGNAPDELFGGAGDDIIGGDGNDNGPDILNGGTGNDTLTGGNGPDVFVFASGDGTDTITDFETPDVIGLAGGLSFADLSFSGSDIIVTSTSEVLATLTGVDATTLTASDFTTV